MPRHRVLLEPFELASHPVTHGELLRFIDDGGYQRPELWLSAGLGPGAGARLAGAALLGAARRAAGTPSRCTARSPVDPHTPVCHVSFYEADAYARWAGRAPADRGGVGARRRERAAAQATFVESGALHPLAPREDAAPGQLAQLFGDVWEWTRSELRALPGLSRRAGRDRRVQRQVHGEPVRAARRLVRHAARAHPRHLPQLLPAEARWQFSGLRLARDAAA